MEGADAVVVPNSEGARTTPSVVALTEPGERLVGQIESISKVCFHRSNLCVVIRLFGPTIV